MRVVGWLRAASTMPCASKIGSGPSVRASLALSGAVEAPGRASTPYKVVVLGDKEVGKTSLVTRFISGVYTSKQQSTIGMIDPRNSFIRSFACEIITILCALE
jgi:GTPase SAR1 family protein